MASDNVTQLTRRAAETIGDMARDYRRKSNARADAPNPFATGSVPLFRWGVVQSPAPDPTASGGFVTLQPCNGPMDSTSLRDPTGATLATVKVYRVLPASTSISPCPGEQLAYLGANAGDILAYVELPIPDTNQAGTPPLRVLWGAVIAGMPCMVKITGTSTAGGGKYTGQIKAGLSAANGSGDYNANADQSAVANCLVVNAEEDASAITGGYTTLHRLNINQTVPGILINPNSSNLIVVVGGPSGTTGGATFLSTGPYGTPNMDAWSLWGPDAAGTGGTSLKGEGIGLTVVTKVLQNAGTTYTNTRQIAFDSMGRLFFVSFETQGPI